jgi:hypothetical protein
MRISKDILDSTTRDKISLYAKEMRNKGVQLKRDVKVYSTNEKYLGLIENVE